MHTPLSVSADGEYSIEFVECLASCGTAPVCMVDDDLLENGRAGPSVGSFSRITILDSQSRPLPHPLERRLIFKTSGAKIGRTDIDCYLRNGGYEQLKKAVKMIARRDRQRGEEVRPARPRRRGFSLRREVELHRTGRARSRSI